MNELQKRSTNLPMPVPDDPTTIGVSVALEVLSHALNTAVEITRQSEAGKTQRAAILAEKEVRIAQISEEIKRGIASDRDRHEQKMKLISIVRDLLVPNASDLTPEIVSAAEDVMQTLKEL